MSCICIGEKFIGKPSSEIYLSVLLKSILDISKKFSVVIKPELLLLHKTIFTLEGICRSVDSEVNIWDIVVPWIKRWVVSPKRRLEKISYLKNKNLEMAQKLIKIISFYEKRIP